MTRGLALATMALLLCSCATVPKDDLGQLQDDDGQWVIPGKNYSSTRYSTLSQINTRNVKKLKHVWSFSTGALRGHEGQPLVVGTTMYVHSAFPNHVYAIDLTQLTPGGIPIKWKYTPEQDPKAPGVACCDLVHRGVNYAEGKILFATLSGNVIALDANTGKQFWTLKAAFPARGETMTMAGLVIKDKYIIGNSGGEYGVRGWIAAIDINKGTQVWRAYSTGPDEDLLLHEDFNKENTQYGQWGEGVNTWPRRMWEVGGGTTWGWYSYDPTLNLLYYSTGNPGSWNPTPRRGDNKWSTTIFARNPNDGKAMWALQMTPFDNHDFDGVNEHILADIRIGGQTRNVLIHLDRNGFAYTLDRKTGSILVAKPFVYLNWATGLDMTTGRPHVVPEKQTKQGYNVTNICPCAMGGKDQQPCAFSPRTGLVYCGTNNMCMDFEGEEVQYWAGQPYVGAKVLMRAGVGGHLGEFIAWDPATGTKRVPGIKEPQPVWSGVLATAGDLVFYGTLDGWFKAVDARELKVLWQHKLPSGIVGNPITYKGPDGKQYVAIYSGVGGWYGLPVAANLPPPGEGSPPSKEEDALGAVGVAYAARLDEVTTVGGSLHVFAIE
jgi:lanthanide-dependent methanol dehydrogenase